MAGTFPVGQRAARSLSERWPAVLPWVSFLSVQGHQRAHMSSFGPCPVADFFLGGPVTGEGTAKGWLRGLSRYPGVPIMKKCPDYRGSRLRTIRLGCSCPNGAGFCDQSRDQRHVRDPIEPARAIEAARCRHQALRRKDGPGSSEDIERT